MSYDNSFDTLRGSDYSFKSEELTAINSKITRAQNPVFPVLESYSMLQFDSHGVMSRALILTTSTVFFVAD